MHEQLQSNQRIAITALEGMGGIGKTELAWEYAQRSLIQNLYSGGVCWLRSRDQEIATQIIDFSKSNLGMKPPDDLEVEAQVSFIWQRWPQGEVLIVVDDVVEYELVASCLPLSNPRFKVLITTRLDFGGSVRSLCLEELDNESALTLLEKLIGQKRVQSQLEDAQTLCGWVGNLPLGLELLGRSLAKKPDWSCQKLIERLESKRLEAKALTATESGMTAQLGVAAALELSWVELSEAEQELACLLGMFAIAPIPWHLVEGCLSDQDKDDLEDIRDEGLIARYLLKRVEQSTYQLHQIVQEFFRIKLNERTDKGESLKAAYCTAMVGVAKGINDSPTLDVIAVMSASIPHLEELTRQWIDHLSNDELMWPYVGIGRFYGGQGNYALALPWYQKCLEQTRQKLGNEHPDVATSLHSLAGLYIKQCSYEEAKTHCIQALQMRQNLLGKEHPDVAISLNTLALLFDNQGRYEEAEPLFLQALEMRQNLLHKEHPYIADSLHNLAFLYRSQGRYEEAEPLFLQALEMRQKLLHKEHPYIASNLNDLAFLYRSQGRYEEAEPLLHQTVEMLRNRLGKEHPYTAISLNDLAALYEDQGRYEEAEILYLEALEIYQKVWEKKHPYAASSLNNLALLYKNQGRYTDAEPLFVQALEMTQKLLGNEHPHTVTVQQNLDAFRQQMKD
ncbi:tetratricopeptide repeat protein [Acaryochloris sp. 'Moss Beach']|uniref:tetratricopeptide repeat protein n=1 Tax=Acaryochloris sp. 'Moss Beach' TaxID=2740837 RepID=UPI001F248096